MNFKFDHVTFTSKLYTFNHPFKSGRKLFAY